VPPTDDPFDDIDRAILNRIQSDFPVTRRPYRSIAKDLDLTEENVIERITRLKKKGIIRRIGGNFAPEKLGFVSTLCAAKVPKDKIDGFVHAVNRYPGVTHNYLRDNPYNIWFTFIAQSVTEIADSLEKISRETGVTGILNLPATKMYKIKAHFDI
jgi:DNA-binding Lrp family transcriptional regulator